MKKLLINLILLGLSLTVMAGGDYGGGPKVIKLYKLDHSVKIGDIKLSKDKKKVKVEVFYQKRRTEFNPFIGEKEAQKLLYGKHAYVTLKYDKEHFNQDLIDKLEKRKRFTFFKKKYKKLAQKNFTVEEITGQINKQRDAKYYEVQMK